MTAASIAVRPENTAKRNAWIAGPERSTIVAPGSGSRDDPVGESPEKSGERGDEQQRPDQGVSGAVLRLDLLRDVVGEPAQRHAGPDDREQAASREPQERDDPLDGA